MLDGNLYGSPVALTGVTTNIPLLTNTLQSGPHVLRVFYSGDSAHQANTSASATLTSSSRSASSPSRPLRPQPPHSRVKAQPVTLTATPAGGFNSTISFACTGGLPSGAVCNFTPSSVTPNGPAPKTTILTISPAGSVLRGAAAETASLRTACLSRQPRSHSRHRRHHGWSAPLHPPASHPPLERPLPAPGTLLSGCSQRLRQRRSRPQRL